jgi:hypothetical protein
MHSHNLPLLAVLWLPAALAALRRVPGVDSRWRRLDPFARGALLLMAVAAAVHVALIPAHAGDPVTAVLFALDASGLAVVGAAGLLGVRGWRAAAALMLLGAVGAYGLYVGAGREVLDLTGIATKAAEVAAVELLVLSRLVGTQRLRLPRSAAALLRGRRVAPQLGDAR